MAFMAFLQVPPAEITVANHGKRNPRYPTQAESLKGILYIQANHQAWKVVCNIGDLIHFYFLPQLDFRQTQSGTWHTCTPDIFSRKEKIEASSRHNTRIHLQ